VPTSWRARPAKPTSFADQAIRPFPAGASGTDTSTFRRGRACPYAAALNSLAAQDLDGAAAGFVDSLRRERRYDDDAARKACVALFAVLGDRHPVTQKHRRAFEMAVF
jgi:hypothetical protein